MKFETLINKEAKTIELDTAAKKYSMGEREGSYEFVQNNGRYMLRLGTKLYKVDNVTHEGTMVSFSMNDVRYEVEVKDEQAILLNKLGFKTNAASAEGLLKAPMPGKILDIMVKEGDEVKKDQPLVILEAMKMENELKAPISGTISSIFTETGQSLEKNSHILEIENIG